MKAIILAGGLGSRLYPLTKHTLKQLLPVYDKPMLHYPLSTLMEFGIKDILIISTKEHMPTVEKALGDGKNLGINIRYDYEPAPNGIAQAFTIGKDFIGSDDVCLILGDNIFSMDTEISRFRREVEKNKGKNATIFAYPVKKEEASRFGIVEFDKDSKVLSIEEKPENPKSNFASVGLYFYPNDVVEKAETLQPSARGELEITDINNLYLEEGRMNVVSMSKHNLWYDAGTPKSLLEVSNVILEIEQSEGRKIGCIEETAYKNGFIGNNAMRNNISKIKKSCEYKNHLDNSFKIEQSKLPVVFEDMILQRKLRDNKIRE